MVTRGARVRHPRRTPNTPNNVLHIVLARGTARRQSLAAQGEPPIAHLTPHTLRRTFASILGG